MTSMVEEVSSHQERKSPLSMPANQEAREKEIDHAIEKKVEAHLLGTDASSAVFVDTGKNHIYFKHTNWCFIEFEMRGERWEYGSREGA